jgi:ribosomal protein L37AE/L43A
MSDASRRAVPFFCPFCGEQDLRPAEEDRAWSCRSCDRVFSLSIVRIGGA